MKYLVKEYYPKYDKNYLKELKSLAIEIETVGEFIEHFDFLDLKSFDEIMDSDNLIYSDENLFSIVEIFQDAEIDIKQLYDDTKGVYSRYDLYYLKELNQYYLFNNLI